MVLIYGATPAITCSRFTRIILRYGKIIACYEEMPKLWNVRTVNALADIEAYPGEPWTIQGTTRSRVIID
jgi:hypothetical protein